MHRLGTQWGRWWVPWFVLAVGLLCTALVTYQFSEMTRVREQQRLQASVTQIRESILTRLDSYVTLLHATAGFFTGWRDVTAVEFHAFVDQLPLGMKYPGVEAIGFLQEVAPEEQALVTDKMRRLGREKFAIWPAGDREVYYPVVYLEPLTRGNEALLGLDAATRPAWAHAMAFAETRATAAFSAKVQFPKELDEEQHEGFLIFLPVYYGGSRVQGPLMQRAEHLLGHAFLIVNANTLFRSMLARLPQERLTVSVYDGETASPQDLLFRGGVATFEDSRGLFTLQSPVPVPGHGWTLAVSTLHPFANSGLFGLAGYVATLGCLITLLLFGITWAQVSAHAAAESSAERRRVSEEALRELNETLEHRVRERTAEAERRATQLHATAVQLTEAEQRERRRIAQVLHDDLQQILVAARLRIERLLRRTKDSEHAEELIYADELLAQGIQSARSLSVDLSPPILHERGLAPALEWLARKMKVEHGLDVHLDVEEDVSPDNEDAKFFLLQAVRELLFNVVKHSGVTHAHVRLAPVKDPFLKISVEDEGAGFDQEEIRSPAGTDEHFGLYSIQQRIELMGGEAEIDSAPGRGTRITLYVPRQLKPEAAVAKPAPAPEGAPEQAIAVSEAEAAYDDSRRIRVLLVDDHKIVRQGLAGLLRGEQDIELVGEASDGIMALEMVRTSQPDVVVMDVTMPRMNGIEATRHITAEFPRIRVIGLSMHEKDDMEAAMHEAGAETYLSKDGASTALVEAIRGAEARI